MAGKFAIVIDDEKEIRDLMKYFLESLGYETETYSDPLNCPLYYENKPFRNSGNCCYDVLIIDHQMPGMTGVDFIRYQREKNCDIRKIAIMSGHWEDETRKAAEQLNCKIFNKPFFIKEIETWLDS